MIIDKERLKGKVFKILPLKEQLDNGQINESEIVKYIATQRVFFKGVYEVYKNDIINDIVITLYGLENTINSITQEQIKSIILKLVNKIDKGVQNES